jgi:hypothetical protein
MIERITTKTMHLQRTSETNEVPLQWAIATLQAARDMTPTDSRAGAILQGWAGCRITYEVRMDDVEYERANKALLSELITRSLADGVLTAEEATALVQAATAAVAP